jgi:peptidoglycan hydrolase-like protein with peptidoglycan-binding domain
MKSLMSILICLAVVFVSNSVADDVVLSAQAKLKQLGYYHGMVDGQMGSQTAAAIRRFQLAKLKVTGEMNAQTFFDGWASPHQMRGPVCPPSLPPGTSILRRFLRAALSFRSDRRRRSWLFARRRRT